MNEVDYIARLEEIKFVLVMCVIWIVFYVLMAWLGRPLALLFLVPMLVMIFILVPQYYEHKAKKLVIEAEKKE